jgi:hypothetical protein
VICESLTPLVLVAPNEPCLGAQVNREYIKRKSSRLDCFLAFCPGEAVQLLSKAVNDFIASTKSAQQRNNQRHFTAVSDNEVWSWIAQRLDISINVKIGLDDAYNSVRWLQ